MKVLILGDSFCEFYDQGTWPWYLKNKTNFEINCSGLGGGSNYVTLEKFKEQYNTDYDYIIVVLTNQLRIPKIIDADYPWLCNHLPNHPLWGKGLDIPKGFEKAVVSYIKFFLDESFLNWVTQQVIEDITATVKENQKIIWIPGVYQENELSSFKKGIKIKGRLLDYAVKESVDWCNISWPNLMKQYGRDPRKNHFTAINQEALAEFIKNIIDKDSNRTLTEEDIDLENVSWNKDKNVLIPQLDSRPY